MFPLRRLTLRSIREFKMPSRPMQQRLTLRL